MLILSPEEEAGKAFWSWKNISFELKRERIIYLNHHANIHHHCENEARQKYEIFQNLGVVHINKKN